jgi:hypothetical protein
MLYKSIRGCLAGETRFAPHRHQLEEQPYPNLPTSANLRQCGNEAIFITGRFRSGSTLLWNIFRQIPGYTAYYEPLNERRWFDPRARGEVTDKTHKQVDDYWREYDGLQELSQYYSENWIRRDLFMSERSWDPNLKRYLEIMIERANGRAVLQFNRADFRLPWLRAAFPRTTILHLYRHPRDQWLSTLHGGPHFPLDGSIADFASFDKFYLLMWARDLKQHFPFLDEKSNVHPYRVFYLIWRLSYLFGRTYADESVAFEDLVQESRMTLERIFHKLQVSVADMRPLLSVIERPRLVRWREYASDDWFAHHEADCERILSNFFAARTGIEHALNSDHHSRPANRVSDKGLLEFASLQ